MDGLQAADQQKLRHMEVSSKTGAAVEEAFRLLVREVFASREGEILAEAKRRLARRRRSSAIGF